MNQLHKRMTRIVYNNTRLKKRDSVKLKFVWSEDRFHVQEKLSFKGWMFVLMAIPFILIGVCFLLPAQLLMKLKDWLVKPFLDKLNENDAISIFLNGNKGRYFYTNDEITELLRKAEDESNKKTSDS